MAVYKVIQDVEAEDKLVGPLTLKAFVYAGISVLLLFICFRLLIAGGPLSLRLLIITLLLPPVALFSVLALPLGREQPTEAWLLSHAQFLFKPRKRIWDQSGLSDLVTITAPDTKQLQFTKNMNQSEVQSRLKALAVTLDSRGWAVKNVNVNLNARPGYGGKVVEPESDRLVSASSMPQNVPVIDIHAADDILDEQSNPTAQNFDKLMRQADSSHKAQVAERINAVRETGETSQSVDFRFLDEQPVNKEGSGNTRFVSRTLVAPEPEEQSTVPKRPFPQEPKVTGLDRAAKLDLIQAAKDDKVSTLSRLANRKTSQVKQIGSSEVEISFH